jgi:hypothetical protein
LLQEHPELAIELEEELERLAEDKVRLEKERDERLAQVDSLERELAEKQKTQQRAEAEKGIAFVSKPTLPTEIASASEETVLDLDSSPKESNNIGTEEADNLPVDEAGQTSSDDIVEEATTATPASGVPETTTEKEDLTLKAIGLEIIRGMFKQAGQELKHFVDLILPGAKQVLLTGDAAWRQLKTIISNLRHQYQETAQDREDEQANESPAP